MMRPRWLPRRNPDPVVRARQWSVALFSTVLATVLGFGVGAVSGAQKSQPEASLGAPLVMPSPTPTTTAPPVAPSPTPTRRAIQPQTPRPAQPAVVSPNAAAPSPQPAVPTIGPLPAFPTPAPNPNDPGRTWWENWLKQFDSHN